jgi:hypothetical protein
MRDHDASASQKPRIARKKAEMIHLITKLEINKAQFTQIIIFII